MFISSLTVLHSSVAVTEEDPDLVSFIRRIIKEGVLRLIKRTNESSDLHFQSLKEIVQEEVGRVLRPVALKPKETRRRPTYATVTRNSAVLILRPPTQENDVWRTVDNGPICFLQ
ncbi:CCHC-type domain-containing protein [Nephila pilipes]|uniref:CCHC-type domain-containing protein n=1 Tax=Nephila pilipes TaxID=299642 RepID=A0A8X6IK79_NEPPI|nr:CCHC-type domain-containing protein [Nephila pilipes]